MNNGKLLVRLPGRRTSQVYARSVTSWAGLLPRRHNSFLTPLTRDKWTQSYGLSNLSRFKEVECEFDSLSNNLFGASAEPSSSLDFSRTFYFVCEIKRVTLKAKKVLSVRQYSRQKKARREVSRNLHVTFMLNSLKLIR